MCIPVLMSRRLPGTPCRRSTWTRGPESLAFLVDHRRNWRFSTSSACSELVLTVQVYVSSPSFYTSSIFPTPTFSKNTLEHRFANFASAKHWLARRLVAVYPVVGKSPPIFSTDPLEFTHTMQIYRAGAKRDAWYDNDGRKILSSTGKGVPALAPISTPDVEETAKVDTPFQEIGKRKV